MGAAGQPAHIPAEFAQIGAIWTPESPGVALLTPKRRTIGMLLYAAADLIWASKIKGVADAVGVAARPVRTMEMLEARLAELPPGSEGGVVALLVDLDKGDEGLALIRRIKADAATKGVRVLAWGPHVAKDLMQAAREAGADDVLTRGAFDHSMDEVLLGLAGRG